MNNGKRRLSDISHFLINSVVRVQTVQYRMFLHSCPVIIHLYDIPERVLMRVLSKRQSYHVTIHMTGLNELGLLSDKVTRGELTLPARGLSYLS